MHARDHPDRITVTAAVDHQIASKTPGRPSTAHPQMRAQDTLCADRTRIAYPPHANTYTRRNDQQFQKGLSGACLRASVLVVKRMSCRLHYWSVDIHIALIRSKCNANAIAAVSLSLLPRDVDPVLVCQTNGQKSMRVLCAGHMVRTTRIRTGSEVLSANQRHGNFWWRLYKACWSTLRKKQAVDNGV